VPGTKLPYLLHVTTVAQEVAVALGVEPGHDGDLAICCALLHDTVEDCGVTVEELRGIFGPAVAAGVAALSKDPSLDKSAAMVDSLDRIRRQPQEVWMVKLADRITNLQPAPAHWDSERRRAYRDEARVILDELGEASPWLAARLRAKIEGYEV